MSNFKKQRKYIYEYTQFSIIFRMIFITLNSVICKIHIFFSMLLNVNGGNIVKLNWFADEHLDLPTIDFIVEDAIHLSSLTKFIKIIQILIPLSRTKYNR